VLNVASRHAPKKSVLEKGKKRGTLAFCPFRENKEFYSLDWVARGPGKKNRKEGGGIFLRLGKTGSTFFLPWMKRRLLGEAGSGGERGKIRPAQKKRTFVCIPENGADVKKWGEGTATDTGGLHFRPIGGGKGMSLGTGLCIPSNVGGERKKDIFSLKTLSGREGPILIPPFAKELSDRVNTLGNLGRGEGGAYLEGEKERKEVELAHYSCNSPGEFVLHACAEGEISTP